MGVASAAGLAGCYSEEGDNGGNGGNGDSGNGGNGDENGNGGNGDNGGNGGNGGSNDFVDTPFRTGWQRDNPTEMNMNPYAANYHNELPMIMYSETGVDSRIDGEWLWLDFEGMEVDEDADELRGYLKEDVHWHQDGEVVDDVTADDWVMQHELDILMTPEDALSSDPLFVDYYAEDDHTYVAELNSDGYNDEMALVALRRALLLTYRNGWLLEYYEELQDASTEDERNDIREEIVQENVRIDDEEMAFSGPYMVENATPSQLELRRNPQHWSAENVNWDQFELVNLTTEGDSDYEAAQQDDTDHRFGIPSTVDEPPEHLTEVASEGGDENGEVLIINYRGDSPEFMHVEEGEAAGERSALIRQAIAHSLDLSTALLNERGERIADGFPPAEKPFPGDHVRIRDQFPDLWDAVPSYVEAEPDLAAEKLERAGLELDGDTWVTPDGDDFVLQIGSYSWARDMMETFTGQLNEVGLETEHRVAEDSVLTNDSASGNYNIAKNWSSYIDPVSVVVGEWFTTNDPQLNQPEEFEIPPIGEYDASPSETVNPTDLSADFLTAPENEHSEEVETLLWTAAYHLPIIPLWPLDSSTGINTNRFDWPSPMPEREDSGIAWANEDHHTAWGIPFSWREIRRGIDGHNAK